jgi:DNA-binding transcriptional ArsR family regulator
MMTSDELEGNTLSVYAFIVRADNPVGLREITRGVELSSSSVAYHHLQKLENLGLIEKNSYGQYSLKKKASVDGYMWVGKNLVPRLMFYSFFFIGLFAVEASTILYYLVIKSLLLEVWFLFFTGTTLVAVLLFLIEGVVLYRKLNPKRATLHV